MGLAVVEASAEEVAEEEGEAEEDGGEHGEDPFVGVSLEGNVGWRSGECKGWVFHVEQRGRGEVGG